VRALFGRGKEEGASAFAPSSAPKGEHGERELDAEGVRERAHGHGPKSRGEERRRGERARARKGALSPASKSRLEFRRANKETL